MVKLRSKVAILSRFTAQIKSPSSIVPLPPLPLPPREQTHVHPKNHHVLRASIHASTPVLRASIRPNTPPSMYQCRGCWMYPNLTVPHPSDSESVRRWKMLWTSSKLTGSWLEKAPIHQGSSTGSSWTWVSWLDYPTLLTGLHWAPIGSARNVCVCVCLLVSHLHHFAHQDH